MDHIEIAKKIVQHDIAEQFSNLDGFLQATTNVKQYKRVIRYSAKLGFELAQGGVSNNFARYTRLLKATLEVYIKQASDKISNVSYEPPDIRDWAYQGLSRIRDFISDLELFIELFKNRPARIFKETSFYTPQNRAERLEATIDSLQRKINKFSTERERYLSDFDKLSADLRARQNELLTIHANDYSNYLKEKKVLFLSKEASIDTLISAIGGKAVGGGFMRNAIKESRSADIFRALSLVSMASIAIYLVASLKSFENHGADLGVVIFRISVALFGSFVVAYLIRQSAVHRAQQHKYQQKAFDLSAVNTYISTLNAEEQNLIKIKIAERLITPPDIQSTVDSANFGVNELLGKIIDKLDFSKK